jgi:hypothetical protein
VVALGSLLRQPGTYDAGKTVAAFAGRHRTPACSGITDRAPTLAAGTQTTKHGRREPPQLRIF